MKTKGKSNEPHKKACKPSPDFHPPHPKKPHLESLKGVLIIDQVKGRLLFLKVVHMEEWKVAKDNSWVKQVRLSSFYKWNRYVYHEGIAKEFVCNWDEGTSSSKV